MDLHQIAARLADEGHPLADAAAAAAAEVSARELRQELDKEREYVLIAEALTSGVAHLALTADRVEEHVTDARNFFFHRGWVEWVVWRAAVMRACAQRVGAPSQDCVLGGPGDPALGDATIVRKTGRHAGSGCDVQEALRRAALLRHAGKLSDRRWVGIVKLRGELLALHLDIGLTRIC